MYSLQLVTAHSLRFCCSKVSSKVWDHRWCHWNCRMQNLALVQRVEKRCVFLVWLVVASSSSWSISWLNDFPSEGWLDYALRISHSAISIGQVGCHDRLCWHGMLCSFHDIHSNQHDYQFVAIINFSVNHFSNVLHLSVIDDLRHHHIYLSSSSEVTCTQPICALI